MRFIEDIAELEALYGQPGSASLNKVAHKLTPQYRKWIMAARFCVVSTVGESGADGSPRGDDGPVVQELDEHHVLLPDWRGNNRMDTLRNIVADGRVALMFFVPGNNNVIRLNGRGRVTLDDDLRQRFEFKEKLPRSVVVISIDEIYSQCARALLRADLWGGATVADVPTAGELLAEQTAGAEGGADYDAAWGARAAKTMW
ncbi:MAG: pyridoxamine 5'-phosphate oxidase family protein [Pseudomonadota bacterium]